MADGWRGEEWSNGTKVRMNMEVRYLPNQESYQRMTTRELRRSFLIEDLFVPRAITSVYCDADRAIIGGAVPGKEPLHLQAARKEMAADSFTERREIGVVNVGGEGKVRVGDADHTLHARDMLYIGRGAKRIEFLSAKETQPARFYFVSFPAHTEYPDALIPYEKAGRTPLGSVETASKRTICRYIHLGGARSCQLVMGLTEVEGGSVWNTMPPHTHQRRMEVYMYYGLDPDAAVVHLMGKPDETRSLVLRNLEAVISPCWSIHCGAGTRSYSFVWAMGGENQEFSDMDTVTVQNLE
jgi:4-deoxy-L-threo-5-hexosulose-uronate ketol-isomerase